MSDFRREYGVETTIPFVLFEADGVNFRVDAAHASGDTFMTKDEGAEGNTTNAFVDEGSGYSIVLTATEMQAARIVLFLVDQDATKVWLDKAIVIETYGHASAQHPDRDVDLSATGLDNVSTAGVLDNTVDLSAAGLDNIVPAEPGAVPTWGSTTLPAWIGWIGAMFRNKMTSTATTATLRNDADGGNLGTSTLSDDGTTFTKGEWS